MQRHQRKTLRTATGTTIGRLFPALVLLLQAASLPAQQLLLPGKEDSLRFAVIGDSGTGQKGQYEVGAQMARFRTVYPFQTVLMLGDNLYGSATPRHYEEKFERPYKPLLDAGVKFHAALGNHDDPSQLSYRWFNMDGRRYYTFRPKSGVRFFALDSTRMDRAQLEWLEKELRDSDSPWKICFFHHPLYSSGKMHGPAMKLRAQLEPLFAKYGVRVVFSGHEHFYERLKPQKGIFYFICGGAGKLRKGNIITKTGLTARGFDTDLHFLLVEIAGNELHFQAVSRTGQTVDSGVIVLPDSR